MLRLKGLSCLLALMAGAISVPAQTGTSTVLGVVSDPTDAVVPNTVLTVTELATGAVYQGVSSTDGLFRFNNLPPGTYKLHIQAQGFKAFELAASSWPARKRATLENWFCSWAR